MRSIFYFLTVLLLFLGPVKADDAADVAKNFLECIRKVFNGGLPSVDVRDFNPLVFDNVSYPLDLIFAAGEVTFSNIFLEGITNFEIQQLDDFPDYNVNGVFLVYSLYWRSLVLEGDWSLKLQNLLDGSGTTKIILNDLYFNGYFNMTLSDEGKPETLDDIVNTISVASTNVTVSNLPEWLFQNADEVITNMINQGPDETISNDLKDFFNNSWISNGTRIDTMLEYCST